MARLPHSNFPRSFALARQFHLLLMPALFWLAACSWLYGQLPATQLSSISPPGGKRQTTLEVQVAGDNLDDLTRMRFSHPGITAKVKTKEPDGLLPNPQPINGVFVVEIGDVPAGIYEATVVGHFGASNPRAFAVGDLEEVKESGNNKSLESAQEVALGTVVSGQADGASRDYYKIHLTQGQRVLVDCLAQRIDSRLSTVLILHDSQGRELQRERGGIDRDPLLDFTAPVEGDYFVGLNDFLYEGGASHFYRLKFHSNPQIDFVMPPSGEAGSKAQYTIYGRNLPDGKPAEGVQLDGKTLEQAVVSIELPGDPASLGVVGEYLTPRAALLDAVSYQINGSNRVQVGIAAAPVVLEQEPNNDAQQVQSIQAPAEVAAQFYPARDSDWFQFEAKKGDVYRIEVFSQQLGQDTDPLLVIQRITRNEKGEESVAELAQVDDPGDRNNRIGGDFDTSTDDPSYVLNVDQDAIYRIGIRDQFGDSRNDPRNVYRLAIRANAPDFRLVALPRPGKVANNNLVPLVPPVVRKAGTILYEVMADRRDGFNGEITVSVEGLPEGVSTPGAVIAADQNSSWLVISAGENAKAWEGPIKMIGRSQLDGKELNREARGGTVSWGTGNRAQSPAYFRAVRELRLSVMESETEPAFVQVGDGNMLETSRGGKLEVPLKVTRRNDFKGDMKLVATGLPNEIKPGDITIKGDASDGKLSFAITNNNAKPGTYSFYLVSDVKFKYQRNQLAVQNAEKTQKEIAEVVARLAEDVKKVTGERDAAKQALQQASDESKAAAEEAMKKAEASLTEAQEKEKRANEFKKEIDKRLDDLKKANAPKDITTPVVSSQGTVRIHASPFRGTAGAASVKQGEKTEVAVTAERLFGFDEEIQVTVEAPQGVAGLSFGKLSIPKGQNEAKLEISAAKDASVGEHGVTIRLKGKFNNVDVEDSLQATVKVEEVKS